MPYMPLAQIAPSKFSVYIALSHFCLYTCRFLSLGFSCHPHQASSLPGSLPSSVYIIHRIPNDTYYKWKAKGCTRRLNLFIDYSLYAKSYSWERAHKYKQDSLLCNRWLSTSPHYASTVLRGKGLCRFCLHGISLCEFPQKEAWCLACRGVISDCALVAGRNESPVPLS